MELKDYYFILGVPRTATNRDILRAFRELAKLYHPDRVGQQGTSSFQDIVEAYEILSNPERRRHYNHSLSEYVDVTPSPVATPSRRARPQPEPLVPEQRRYGLHRQPEPLVPESISILHDFGTSHPTFETLRHHFLQNFTNRGTPKSERIERLTAEVRLSPYEALHGVIVPVGIPVFVRCARCDGSGRDWFSQCPACWGQGMVETERTVNVRIPPQVREGTVIEVPLGGLGIHNLSMRLHIRISW